MINDQSADTWASKVAGYLSDELTYTLTVMAELERYMHGFLCKSAVNLLVWAISLFKVGVLPKGCGGQGKLSVCSV